MKTILQIKNLIAGVGSKDIIQGIDLKIRRGEFHVIMGPNGSGKSTLAHVLAGNPKYSVKKGKIIFLGKDITHASPEDRALSGMFLAFQYPREIQGVELNRFLFLAYNNLLKFRKPKLKATTIFEFQEILKNAAKDLKMNPELGSRSINEGFSGGEKKKAEMLQLTLLDPIFAILDETDSGLDVDALKIVAHSIHHFHQKEKSVLLVTHYQRILKYLKPDYIHVMVGGRLVKSGGPELAKELEKRGYEQYKH